jgi:hypothetical protein
MVSNVASWVTPCSWVIITVALFTIDRKRSTTDASLRAIAENLRGVSEAGQRRSAGIFQGSSLS